MIDISKCTPNVQKYIRYDWAACEAGLAGNEGEAKRILEEKHQFKVNNFTLNDYDSMINHMESQHRYLPMINAWKRARERYISEHQQIKIRDVEKETVKLSNKQLRKAI